MKVGPESPIKGSRFEYHVSASNFITLVLCQVRGIAERNAVRLENVDDEIARCGSISPGTYISFYVTARCLWCQWRC